MLILDSASIVVDHLSEQGMDIEQGSLQDGNLKANGIQKAVSCDLDQNRSDSSPDFAD